MQKRVHVNRTFEKNPSIDELLEGLFQDRNITNPEEFLHPKKPQDVSLAQLMNSSQEFSKQWTIATRLLKKHFEEKNSIVVYSDYDADGITGGAIMWEGLHKLGFNVMPYIPPRLYGYGFSKEGIEEVIKKYDPKLIITVDHGIVADDLIAYIRQRNIDVIVTDHHHIQDAPPHNANAVFHSTDVSGSVMAYFFIKQLAEDMQDIAGYENTKAMIDSDFLAFAAIGLIADMVPLKGVARSVAKYGLESLTTTQRLGLRQILKDAGIISSNVSQKAYSKPNEILTPYHVGFIIAPRLNAFGRLESAVDALRLLCTNSYERAIQLSSLANDINKRRQDLTFDAHKIAEKSIDPSQKILIAQSEEWEEGIIGLIASRLLQKYYKPAIAITHSNGHAKASVRSVDDVHITDFLKQLDEYFIDMGGHAGAAGFSIKKDRIEEFIHAAYALAQSVITDEMLVPIIKVDARVPLGFISDKLYSTLEQLQPFGVENQQPLFQSIVTLEDVQAFGKLKTHAKFLLSDGNTHFIEGVYFNGIHEAREIMDSQETKEGILLSYTVGYNNWNKNVELTIKDLRSI